MGSLPPWADQRTEPGFPCVYRLGAMLNLPILKASQPHPEAFVQPRKLDNFGEFAANCRPYG